VQTRRGTGVVIHPGVATCAGLVGCVCVEGQGLVNSTSDGRFRGVSPLLVWAPVQARTRRLAAFKCMLFWVRERPRLVEIFS